MKFAAASPEEHGKFVGRHAPDAIIAAFTAGTGEAEEAGAELETKALQEGMQIVEEETAKGIRVIGPRDTYREFAKKISANFLDVSDEEWSMRKNVQFLQGVVKRGDDVIFAGKYNPKKLDPNSILGQEIRYLQRHGYSWNDDFSRMIKK